MFTEVWTNYPLECCVVLPDGSIRLNEKGRKLDEYRAHFGFSPCSSIYIVYLACRGAYASSRVQVMERRQEEMAQRYPIFRRVLENGRALTQAFLSGDSEQIRSVRAENARLIGFLEEQGVQVNQKLGNPEYEVWIERTSAYPEEEILANPQLLAR